MGGRLWSDERAGRPWPLRRCDGLVWVALGRQGMVGEDQMGAACRGSSSLWVREDTCPGQGLRSGLWSPTRTDLKATLDPSVVHHRVLAST